MAESNSKKRNLADLSDDHNSQPARKRLKFGTSFKPISDPQQWTMHYLQKFGHRSFRPGQKEIITDAVEGKDVMINLRTNYGKSLCFQIASLVRNRMYDNWRKRTISVMILPLVALIADQVAKLKQNGIRVAVWNSTVSPKQKQRVKENLKDGMFDILYTTPESLLSRTNGIKDTLAKYRTVTTVSFDEAHCIMMWGSGFRPCYFRMADVLTQFGRPTVMACTATVSDTMCRDIANNLQIKQFKVYSASPNRANIRLEIRQLAGKKHIFRVAKKLIEQLLRKYPNDAIIVFGGTIKITTEFYEYLKSEALLHIVPGIHHSKIKISEKNALLNDFLNGTKNVVVATSGFGMGIDKANVRAVIHLAMPTNPEEWAQQMGRAGRDGKQSYAYLLTHDADFFASLCVNRSEKKEITRIGQFLFDHYESNQARRIGDKREIYQALTGNAKMDWYRYMAAMRMLQRYGIIDIAGNNVYLLKKEESIDSAEIDWKELSATDQKSLRSYRKMKQIVNTNECIRRRFLAYFGDEYIPNDSSEQYLCCSNCSN